MMNSSINHSEMCQTIELSSRTDWYTGQRAYKLIRLTRNPAGKIIKRESAGRVELNWKEASIGDPCMIFLIFEEAEMEDSRRGEK